MGNAWWQVGSSVYNELKIYLPENVRLHEEGGVFHWSGLNKQSERFLAGLRLLEKLIGLEKKGIYYHLVGHSHGGTVIVEALCESIRRLKNTRGKNPSKEIELNHLLSWTTIGTPFLSIAPTSKFKPDTVKKYNRNKKILEVGSILLSIYAIFLFSSFLFSSIAANDFSIYTQSLFSNWNIFYFAMVIAIHLVLVGFFLRNYKIYSIEYRIRLEEGMKKFDNRWLGLTHHKDEAISTISASIHPYNREITPRFRSKKYPWLGRPIWNWFSSLIFTNFEWYYNKIIAPILDRIIISRISASIQGNDLPRSKIKEVSLGAPFCRQKEYLPHDVSEELEKFVIEQNSNILPNFRDALLLTSYKGFEPEQFIQELEKGEMKFKNQLIHNAYFSNLKILKLIALNIIHSSKRGEKNSTLPQNEKELWDWIFQNKSSQRLIIPLKT